MYHKKDICTLISLPVLQPLRPCHQNVDLPNGAVPVSDSSLVDQPKSNTKGVGAMTELEKDTLSPNVFYNLLHKVGVDFFCGVPDSLLKGWFTSIFYCCSTLSLQLLRPSQSCS